MATEKLYRQQMLERGSRKGDPLTLMLGMEIGNSHCAGLPEDSVGKEASCSMGDLALIPGLGPSPGEGKGYPLQDSNLENSMDCIGHRVTKSQTRLTNSIFHSVYVPHFFIHSSVDGHLGCFRVLPTINSAAMNNGIHVSFAILVSSGYMPMSGITGSYGGLFSSFVRNLHTVFHSSCFDLHPTNSARVFPFLQPSQAFIVCRLFDYGHSDQCELISYCSFDLHFSSSEQC